MSKLTNKQKRFIEEYLIDLNATKASIRAGYSEDTAQQIGSENLSKLVIQNAIQKAQRESAQRNSVTVDEITEMHREAYSVAKEVKQASAMTTAAHNLAKLHGLIIDRSKIEQEKPEPMTFIFGSSEQKGDITITKGKG